ncbi:MAG: LysR family transcriptional regulator [Alphaproteobacteria bacterium]|nr:LysR family transcriptional regulator [Alphaproteobacteria bacterium]
MDTYKLDDWDDIRVFVAVAEAGSFVTAAHYLRTSQSTISRRIQELECRLGAKLFDRSVRGARLTPQGRTIQEAAKSMERAALDIEKGVAGVDREMRGTVTITATEGVGSYWLVPRLLDFQRRNPGICISLDTSNDLRKLENREADIALRFGRPAEVTYRTAEPAFQGRLHVAMGTQASPNRVAKTAKHSISFILLFVTAASPTAWLISKRAPNALSRFSNCLLAKIRAKLKTISYCLIHPT